MVARKKTKAVKQKRNAVGWFEIPVTDMERAMRFYGTVFGIKLERHEMGPLDMAWFSWTEDGIGAPGSLVRHKEYYKPSSDGVLVYFTSQAGDLSVELARVNAAGGKVLMPKKSIGEHGNVAFFLDTEGNRIALHSMK